MYKAVGLSPRLNIAPSQWFKQKNLLILIDYSILKWPKSLDFNVSTVKSNYTLN